MGCLLCSEWRFRRDDFSLERKKESTLSLFLKQPLTYNWAWLSLLPYSHSFFLKWAPVDEGFPLCTSSEAPRPLALLWLLNSWWCQHWIPSFHLYLCDSKMYCIYNLNNSINSRCITTYYVQVNQIMWKSQKPSIWKNNNQYEKTQARLNSYNVQKLLGKSNCLFFQNLSKTANISLIKFIFILLLSEFRHSNMYLWTQPKE